MAQWKIKVVPSGPCRMVGFVEKVGAIPSTCGKDGASIGLKFRLIDAATSPNLFF
jgi:hypothetical protein